MSGYEFLATACKRWPSTPFLMITAYATPKLAVEAIKSGAIDYLAKPFAPEELLHAVARCAERHRLLAENAALRAHAAEPLKLDRIIGDSPKMMELKQLIQSVAPTNATVLVLGESGTGKELIAGAMHSLSRRADKNYVRINCAAIPENLLESELFGHEKGAFTGAVRQKLGRVEEADGGTIFLDEIGDMSRSLQAKLLRFLEDGTFTRVGGNEELKVDVRLIAATNRDIIEAIRQNNFREDLFHRLNVVQLRPPPLRERGADIMLLAENFLAHFGSTMNKHIRGFSAGARNKLLSHHWPGNVRELRNVIEHSVAVARGAPIEPQHLPRYLPTQKASTVAEPTAASLLSARASSPLLPATTPSQVVPLQQAERVLIACALEEAQGNKALAARLLGVSRHQLYSKLERLGFQAGPSSERRGP